MKSFEISMFVILFFGFSMFSGLDTPAYADFTFGEPINLGEVINTYDYEIIGCISSDGLEMYFDRKSIGGNYDIYVSKREAIDSNWSNPENIGPPINISSSNQIGASITADGLTIYYTSDQSGGYGSSDLYTSTREAKDEPWGSPMNMGLEINSSAFDGYPCISANGLELYFVSYRAGGYGNGDIWLAKRATEQDPWDYPVNLGLMVNTMYYETNPWISPDGLLLLFCDHPSGPSPDGYGSADNWMTTRTTPSDPWQLPVNLGPEVNGPSADLAARLSFDGRTLYFTSSDPRGYGSYDIWQASVEPVVDFSMDGILDILDLWVMIENWGTSNPLCDIGPMPWGDGVVDIGDLKVFIDYWELENMPELTEVAE